MAAEFGEGGDLRLLLDNEVRAVMDEPRIREQQAALETALVIKAFDRATPESIREAMGEMSPNKRLRFVRLMQKVSGIAERGAPFEEALDTNADVFTLVEPKATSDLPAPEHSYLKFAKHEQADDLLSLLDEASGIELAEPRVKQFMDRVAVKWGDSDFPLDIDEDAAWALVDGYHAAEGSLKTKNAERFALRLSRLLEGKTYQQIAELESTEYGEEVKASAIQVFLSNGSTTFAAKYLRFALDKPELPATEVEGASNEAPDSQPTDEPESIDNAEDTLEELDERKPYSPPVLAIKSEAEVDKRVFPDAQTEDEETATEATDTNPGEPDLQSNDHGEAKDIDENLQDLANFDWELAELQIEEMQRDGMDRHRKGLDAIDIAEVYQVKPDLVRNVYRYLLKNNKLNNTPANITLKREGGQLTSHYRHKTLYVLLPAVVEAAKEEHAYHLANAS